MRRISLIILSIFLIHSSPASAGVGDVYSCLQKEHIRIENFKLTLPLLEKFTFKRTAQGLIFGNEEGSYSGGVGFFSGAKFQRKIYDIGTELFKWGDENSNWFYEDGHFTSVLSTFSTAVAIQGTCEVFD